MSEEQIKYQKYYIPLTRDELVERLHLALRPKRFNHVLRVEKTAIKLAKTNGVDPELMEYSVFDI